MRSIQQDSDNKNLLRQQAEDALQGKPVDLNGLDSEDIQYLVHELQVHQMELSLQNDELHDTQLELETSRDRYSDLYDFAPVGYCTLNRKGTILEANETLAYLLRVDRGQLIDTPLSHFVAREDQDTYYLHRQRTFEEGQRQVCELHLVKQTGEAFFGRMESQSVQGDQDQMRVILSDTSQLHQMEIEVREKAEALRELQHRLLDQREQERQQIARDLHDGVVQELTGVTFTLRSLLMQESNPDMVPQLEAIQTTLQSQINELRTYAGELRPPTLAKFGVEQAIRSHVDTFQENHPAIHVQVEIHTSGTLLPESTALAIFRVYQQALNNILKHAQATEVLIALDQNELQVCLEMHDNGQGFVVPEDWLRLARAGHLGLVGMHERAEAVGGSLDVTSQPGSGAVIQLCVPLDR